MNQSTHNKRNKLLVAIVIASVVLFANIILIFVLKSGNRDNNPPSTEPTKNTAINQTESVIIDTTEHQQREETTDEPVVPTQSDAECFQIDTPYGNLSYPTDWKDFLDLEFSEQDPYSVTFRAKLETRGIVPLFSIIFGGNSESAVGAVKMDDGQKVNVNLQIHKITPDATWSDSDIAVAFAMQEAMNDVLSHMPMEAPVPAVKPQPTEPSTQPTEASTRPTEPSNQATEPSTRPSEPSTQPTDPSIQPTESQNQPTEGQQPPKETETQVPEQELDLEDMAIDTPWGEIHYPSKWSGHLELEVKETEGYSVTFYCKLEGHDRQPLFTIHLGGIKGTKVGILTAPNGDKVEVRVTIHEFAPADAWTEEESNAFYAMQEELNYLMEKLK